MSTIPPLVFTYQDGEMKRFRKLAGRSFNRANSESSSWWGLLLAMIFVIGLAVFAAQRSGLVAASQVPVVLITAYAAYACGAVLIIVIGIRRQRQYDRAVASGPGETEREVTISEAGLAHKSANYDLRVGWKAVKSVEALPGVVIIWLHWLQFMSIPARAFADDAARRAFIASVQAFIDGERTQQT
jgi:hypothetical protein